VNALDRALVWVTTIALGTAVTVIMFGIGPLAASRHAHDKVTVVVASKPLDRFQELTVGDITLASRHVAAGMKVASAATNVLGKALLRPVAKDGVIDPADLVDPDTIAGRTLVTVTALASADAPTVGKKAVLVASPKERGFGAVVLDDVVVVRASKSDDGVAYTIAITPDALSSLAAVLSTSDIRIAPLPAPP
jgi:hypothetical protein